MRILSEQGQPLVAQLIHDSGIELFRSAITNYLLKEKRPLLLVNLAEDLQPLCIHLRRSYLEEQARLRSQPTDVSALKDQELRQLSLELQQVGEQFRQHLEMLINQVIASNGNPEFEAEFEQLQRRMVQQLDGLIAGFSVSAVHQRAQASHRRNSVVPLLGILAEAFYYLANGLEDTLVEAAQELVQQFFQQVRDMIPQQDYYRQLFRMLGNDGGIEAMLDRVAAHTRLALVSAAQTECDRYVRECPEFFEEETASIFQLRETLQQACRGYDYQNMVQAEPAIRQLLRMDFEQKVSRTVLQNFRQVINQTLNVHLLPAVRHQVEVIQEQYDQARQYLAAIVQKEAEEKLRENQRQLEVLRENMHLFNAAVTEVNVYLVEMGCDRHQLPLLDEEKSDRLTATVM
ncbi:MAG: hypothetical protein VKJ24_13435 [Synechococcales bacterium]|nr:hypothetical protein [Synechococcales bacterium]